MIGYGVPPNNYALGAAPPRVRKLVIPQKLTPTVRVRRYRLRVRLDAPEPTYGGSVEIEVDDMPSEMAVQAVGLTPGVARLQGTEVSIEVRPEQQEWILHGVAPSPHALLEIHFEGTAASKVLDGYYRSRFGADYIYTTDFEPAAARQAFPCIDRPDQKAIFELEIEARNDLTVLSNMPAASTTPRGDRKVWHFLPTPPMATYLLYWAVGPFQERTSNAFRVPVHIAFPAGREAETGFALDVAPRLLASYEEYYGVPYPLPKLHLVAVPEFGSGAMENWGAIAFREMHLLQSASGSVGLRRLAVSVISHEIAHQWFGDLVTMAWWNDLWLNESFATFVGAKIQDRVFPDHEAAADLLLTWIAPALTLDGLESSHPIRGEVQTPQEVQQVFDQISYGKGAGVLRMIEGFLGEPTFRDGVRHYLEEFAFRNAHSSDLWNHLSAASSQPVDRILDRWTGESGFPILVVRRRGGSVEVTQQPFRYLGSGGNRLWPIPLTYWSQTIGRQLLEGPTTTIAVPPDQPFLLNVGRTGFYRVEYDAQGYDALARALPSIGAIDRWGILDDLYALLQAGRADFDQYRRWVERTWESTDHLLVQLLLTQLSSLARLVDYQGPVADLEKEFLTRQLTRLGFDRIPGEPENHVAERENVLTEAAFVDPAAARRLSDAFSRYADLDASIRSAVLIAYAREGGEEASRELTHRLTKEARDEEAIRIVRGLASARSPETIRTLLEGTLDGSVNRTYLIFALVYSAIQPRGTESSWRFFQMHREEIREVVRGTPYVSGLLDICIPAWGIRSGDEVRRYFAEHSFPEMELSIRKGLERLAIQERLLQRLPRT